MTSFSVRNITYPSIFTALMIVGTYIQIPIGPVPIVLTNLFVILAGLTLGAKWGTFSVFLYLILGALGFTVFSKGGGLALFAGPTGGFLFGYLASAFTAGILSSPKINRHKTSTLVYLFASFAANASIYFIGLPWLKIALDLSWQKTLTIGLLPFLPGDALKIAAAVWIASSVLSKIPPHFLPGRILGE